jgi:hypothetical protein
MRPFSVRRGGLGGMKLKNNKEVKLQFKLTKEALLFKLRLHI